MTRAMPPAECPVCGASVPPMARACPECGADERTGWNEEATQYDGLDLPNAAFDEDAAIKDRSMRSKVTKTGVPYLTWIVALGMIALVATLIAYRWLG